MDAFKILNMSHEQRQLAHDKVNLLKEIKILHRASVKGYNVEKEKIMDQLREHRREYEEKNCGNYKPIYPILEPKSDELLIQLK